MKRFYAFWIGLLALALPARAFAGTPYTIHWLLSEDPGSCEVAVLGQNGAPYFHANGTPLPTFELPETFAMGADGSTSEVAEAGFDSVLLRWGANSFDFKVQASGGDDSCVRASEIVHLVSPSLGVDKLLFDIRREGVAFTGSTNLDLHLEEINPPLARDIANLEAEIEAERESLLKNASRVEALAEKLDQLQALDTELSDLLKRPLDEIAAEDLDAILGRYADVVGDDTRASLEQLIGDLKQSVLDLQNELASLIDQFGQQADAVADLATSSAVAAGFDPDDPSGYGLGPADTPWIEVPDVSGVKGAFEEGSDPYAAYADAVLKTLGDYVQGGQVVQRGSFAAVVRAWRANQEALEKALLARVSVSQAETNAFLNAQTKVTSYVLQFMDGSYWYLNTPVPPDLRAAVDGVLKKRFGPLADEMKDNLNEWDEPSLDLEHTQLVETIRAFAGAIDVIGDVAEPYFEMMGTLVYGTTRLAAGFVPFVGPMFDLCEAVTGKGFCLPEGKDLSTEERVLSGVGFGIGAIGHAWSGVKNAGISPAGKAAAEGVLSLGDEFATALQASRRTWYKTLRGAVGPIANEFEAKAGMHLMENEGRALIGVGDNGVRKVLGIPSPTTQTVKGIAQAPDFLSVTKSGGLALSEVKGGTKIDAADAVSQIRNALLKLKELNLIGDVERVEIIMKSGETFENVNHGIRDGYLVNKITGLPIPIEGFPLLFVKVLGL